jgi:hypothetical protein
MLETEKPQIILPNYDVRFKRRGEGGTIFVLQKPREIESAKILVFEVLVTRETKVPRTFEKKQWIL